MKILAGLLIGCVLFLSSFSGMDITRPMPAKMDCCKKMSAKGNANHKTTRDENSGCEKPGCAMLFSCSICGFIPAAKLNLPSAFSFLIKKPVSLYKSGDLSAYHKADWKPPKTC